MEEIRTAPNQINFNKKKKSSAAAAVHFVCFLSLKKQQHIFRCSFGGNATANERDSAINI